MALVLAALLGGCCQPTAGGEGTCVVATPSPGSGTNGGAQR